MICGSLKKIKVKEREKDDTRDSIMIVSLSVRKSSDYVGRKKGKDPRCTVDKLFKWGGYSNGEDMRIL